MNKFFYIVFTSVFILCSACKKKEAVTQAPVAQIAKPTTVATPEEITEKPIYVYSGDKFRDPFTPAGASNNYQPEAVFDPQRATVKGIVFSTNLKSAVLVVSGSGTYFVKGAQIFDIMGKTVKGFTAKVLKDRVVISSDADTVYEIRIKNPDEEEVK